MTEKARIIVCDDEEPMRELLEELLTDEGYAVATARDGLNCVSSCPRSGLIWWSVTSRCQ